MMKSAWKSIDEIYRQLIYILNRKRKKQFILLFILTWIAAGAEMLGISAILPFVQALINLDQVIENKYIKSMMQFFGIKTISVLIVFLGIGIIGVYVIKNIYLLMVNYATFCYQTGVQNDLSVFMLRQYLKRPYIYFVNNNSNTIIRNVDSDTEGIAHLIQSLMRTLTEGLTSILICVLLFMTDAILAFGVFFVALICFLSIILGCRSNIKKNGAERRQYAMLKNKSIRELLEGIKEVQVMNRGDCFLAGYERNVQRYRKTVIGESMYSVLPEKTIEAVCVAGLIGMVCLRIAVGVDPQDFVPQLAVFAVAAFRILPSIARIISGINIILFRRPALQGVYENLREIEEYNALVKDIYDKVCVDDSREKVTFQDELAVRNVTWRYPGSDRSVLQNVNLVVKKNQSIALIGESGAGKTTLGDIILGLFRPQEGQVLLDGIDIRTIPSNWSRLIGFVPQYVFLADDTIRNNIAFGIEQEMIDDAKIWHALDQAQLKNFVAQLPEGLDTIVGEQGIKFSGGQRQRIAIARALYTNPNILVLDEATASLDAETEAAVIESIEALQGQVTLIIIAHRLTTIQKCDEIYEVKEGKILRREKREVI